MVAKVGIVARTTALVAVLVYCLFDYALQHYGPLRNSFGAFDLVFLPQTQWVAFALACVWCAGLMVLAFDWKDVWLIGLLVIAVLAYSANYARAASDVNAVTLLIAVAVGKGILLIQRRKLTLSCLIALLAMASCLHLDTKVGYYHGPRWMGLWYDPNIYGILMGTGFLLALGLALNKTNKFTISLLYGAAAIVLGFGLLKSYSRGAWCGAFVGFIYLLMHLPKVRQNRMTLLVGIFLTALILCNFQEVKWHPVRRALSVMNTHDFSRENRITAWRGALQIMAEHPWSGVGWTMSEEIYQSRYMPPKLTSGALFTNSYAVLGTELGLPALICFVVYIWLSLSQRSGVEGREQTEGGWNQKSGIAHRQDAYPTLDWVQMTCRAGAIVLAIGFWFDGKLYDLSLASTFWILLELGASRFTPAKVAVSARRLPQE